MTEDKKVRVRFAPSPTGGLHLGGVRTALFNYLYAKKYGGDFLLRIEDTDQTRYVLGAEEYITDCLKWCGISPDESPEKPGAYGPYRQSERKAIYRQYAEQLVAAGYAYYAFDTPEELESQRSTSPNFKYNHENRDKLNNSLRLGAAETQALVGSGIPHVIRIKVPSDETVNLQDEIRGNVSFETSLVDDKVLLKADGMPTYHLAVVVDDYLMKITHVFRGEEWLPSAPVHVLLWEYLGWSDQMPKWVHLPLILKPDGHGKLSKRDGARLGFPVYAMNWTDPKTGELTEGFRELGYLPEAFINMLALLGWNDGTEQELFTLKELISKFDLDRVSKAGAKFDIEKARWFNHEWLKQKADMDLLPELKAILATNGHLAKDDAYLLKVFGLLKDRIVILSEFWQQASYFFSPPVQYDLAAVKPKWSLEKTAFYTELAERLSSFDPWHAGEIEHFFKLSAESTGLKPGELMLPLRIMLVGGKFGPHVFDIAELLGREETVRRIHQLLEQLQ
ncbi:glutamyl-tRNA synthetase [bacterium A37T11]|nr:glutamyl-tRNA synthetase [bacterium A37T11]